MPILKSVNRSGSLQRAIEYAAKDNLKACNGQHHAWLTRGINCSCFHDNAIKQMTETANFVGKNTGRKYKHYILSFSPEELSKERSDDVQIALNYAEVLIRQVVGSNYQAFLGGHVNSMGDESDGCLHVHIVIGSAGRDGKKLQSSPKDWERLKQINDSLAIKYGFKIVGRNVNGRPKLANKNEYRAAKRKGLYIKGLVIDALCKILAKNPVDFKQFTHSLQEQGWNIVCDKLNCLFVVQEKPGERKYKFNLRLLAKQYNILAIEPSRLMQSLNVPDWQKYEHSSKSFKRQCADTILDALLSKPKDFKSFCGFMENSGWKVMVSARNIKKDDEEAHEMVRNKSIKFIKINGKRKSGRDISFNANRLAVDFQNVDLSCQIIRQTCCEPDYLEFFPSFRKNKKIAEYIFERSKLLEEERRLEIEKEKNMQEAVKQIDNMNKINTEKKVENIIKPNKRIADFCLE